MTVAFIDCETTGLDSARHEMWELAIILRRSKDDVEYLWQFRTDLSTADPAALRIGRYYERYRVQDLIGTFGVEAMQLSGPGAGPGGTGGRQEDTAAQIAWLLDGATLVGAVPSFDAAFLDRWLRRHGQCPTWHHRLRCVETLTAGHLRNPAIGGLKDCCSALGIVQEGEHTALGDARAARDIWDHIVGPGANRPSEQMVPETGASVSS